MSETMFHEDLDTCQELGLYTFEAGGILNSAFGGNGEIEYYLPSKIEWAFGPLPSTNDEAVALTCEVQFARMEVAWIMKSPFRLSSNDIRASYADSRVRFAIEGERSLSLYRDMERVTKELGGGE